MLRDWPSHEEYQKNLLLNLALFYETDRERVVELEKSISKLYLLNLDPAYPIVITLYSDTGRPAKNQQGIIWSLILMLDQDEHDIPKWAAKVASDSYSALSVGLSTVTPQHSVPIMIFWQASHDTQVARKKKLCNFYSKPRKKLKVGKKYVLHPSTTASSKRLPLLRSGITSPNIALR